MKAERGAMLEEEAGELEGVAVVVQSRAATNDDMPRLSAGQQHAEGLAALSIETLCGRVADGMDASNTARLEQAVRTNDLKQTLVATLVDRAARQQAAAPKVEAIAVAEPQPAQPAPSFCGKFRGVDRRAPTPIPKASHVLGSGLTSFLGLGLLSLVHFGRQCTNRSLQQSLHNRHQNHRLLTTKTAGACSLWAFSDR